MIKSLYLLIFAVFASAKTTPALTPGQELLWQLTSPEQIGIEPKKLVDFDKYAFRSATGWATDAVLVLYKGHLIYERYAPGYGPDTKHSAWSMSKSFTSIFFGLAESRGFIHRDDTVLDYYKDPSWSSAQNAALAKLSLMNELSMLSGRQWSESYRIDEVLKSDIVAMLYGQGRADQAYFAAAKNIEPRNIGKQFHYDTGNFNVVSGALKKSLGLRYNDFLKRELFAKIGMQDVTFEQDVSGTMIGGSYLWARPRDFAKFGYLLLKKGRWRGSQIIPPEWLQKVTSLNEGFIAADAVAPDAQESKYTYGAGFWLNQKAMRWKIPVPMPSVPEDAFFAWGHRGQALFVIPSQQLVVLRLAHDDIEVNWDEFLRPLTNSAHVYPEIEDPSTQVSLLPLSPSPAELATMLELMGAQRAKDICSCHFVARQEIQSCLQLSSNGLPISNDFTRPFGVALDELDKSVEANGKKASWISQQSGCLLQ